MLNPIRVVRLFLGKASYLLLCLLFIFCSAGAKAGCLESPYPDLYKLADLAGQDPHSALREAEAVIESANVAGSDITKIAWLYAIQADALSYLSRPEEARAAAQKGLDLVTNSHDPVHSELLAQYAQSSFKRQEMEQAILAVNAERVIQKPGSAADVCLQGTLGDLQKMSGQPGLAITNLTEAYKASMGHDMNAQRAYIAVPLYKLMKIVGDYAQALALNQEVVDWDRRHERTLALSVDLYDRARILLSLGKYEAALELFAQSGKLSAPLKDDIGDAYIDLYSCDALVKLGKLPEAQRLCLSAEHVFSLNNDDGKGQAKLFLSRIALYQGHASQALNLLDGLIEEGGAENAVVSGVTAYELRAQAHAALRDDTAAYKDLLKYIELYKKWNDSERTSQTAILRARFENDTQNARNRELQHEVQFSKERELEQSRITLIVIVCSGVVIALLGYILLLAKFHRTKLLQLANNDTLTGLLNRRCIIEQSTTLLRSGKTVRPLTIAILDLDHFKYVNDTFGHAAGDQVLRAFANTARKFVRGSDILGRWGGEEFLLVLPNTMPTDGSAILDRVRAAVDEIRLPFSTELRIRFSAGIAADTVSPNNLDEIINRADTALYKAKAKSRNMTWIDEQSIQVMPEKISLGSLKSGGHLQVSVGR